MRSHVSHILTFSHSLNQLKERDRARNGSIMSRKPGKGPIVTGQLSEKARRILLKRSRANSLNLAAAKLRGRKKLSKKVVPDAAKGWSATRIQDEQTNLVSFDIYGPTKGGGTFTVSIPAEQREEQKRVRKTLRSYDAALPGQFDDDLAFLEKLSPGPPKLATPFSSRAPGPEAGSGCSGRTRWPPWRRRWTVKSNVPSVGCSVLPQPA